MEQLNDEHEADAEDGECDDQDDDAGHRVGQVSLREERVA